MANLYGYECGVLLTKDDPEYKQYSCNNPALPFGFYDEDQGFCGESCLEETRARMRKYVESGVDKTYAIISLQCSCDESQLHELLENQEVTQMEYSFFKNQNEVVYSVCKIYGAVVEGFLENMIAESLDREDIPVMQIADIFTESFQSSFYTISLCPDRFVDVKVVPVSPDSNLIYIMQNADGSTVYGVAGSEQTYPDFRYDEAAVIEFVKKAHHSSQPTISSEKPSLDFQICRASRHELSPVPSTNVKAFEPTR